MSQLRLVLEHLRYFRIRSLLMLLTVTLAFVTFGILGALRYSLDSGDSSIAERRLIVAHEAGLMQTLPIAYLKRIAALPGVETVSHATWQGNYYREARDMMMSFAVDPATWLAGHPDMEMSATARRAFLADRRAMLVAQALAAKYGWKVGDQVPLSSMFYAAPKGDPAWTYLIAGTFVSSDAGGGRNYAITHFDYLNENRQIWRDTVGTFVVTPRPGISAPVLAQQIDALFAGSESPTSTTTDRAFHAEFFTQFGDIVRMIKIVVGVTFLSLILVVTSGIALSTRQRSRDIGVLRVVGFSPLRVYSLIVGQTGLIVAAGAVAGLLLAALFNRLVTAALPQFLPDITMPLPVIAEAAAIAGVLALVTAAMPAMIALRVRPVAAFAIEQG